jgi:nucleoside-diphosphate-sugar epimerase
LIDISYEIIENINLIYIVDLSRVLPSTALAGNRLHGGRSCGVLWMRVLVTGGTGFIGSHTTVALLEAGHEVRLLVRDPARLAGVFEAHGLAVPDHRVGDIGDAASVRRALLGCDAVVHDAALVALDSVRAREVVETNPRGAENVMRAALELGLSRMIYMSSISALFRPNRPLVSAEVPVVPGESAYARSKSDAELVVRQLQDQGAPIQTVYPAAVIGPDDPTLSPANQAVRTFVRYLAFTTSSGFQFVDVRDLATVQVRLLELEGAPGRHIAAGHFLRWHEFADAIVAVTGVKKRRLPVPGSLLRAAGRIGDALDHVWHFDLPFPLTSEATSVGTQWAKADSSKTLEALGLGFRDPLETLADTIRWLQRAGHVDARYAGRLAFARVGAPYEAPGPSLDPPGLVAS